MKRTKGSKNAPAKPAVPPIIAPPPASQPAPPPVAAPVESAIQPATVGNAPDTARGEPTEGVAAESAVEVAEEITGEPAETPEEKYLREVAAAHGEKPQAPGAVETELRADGPTLEEFVAAGYPAENYPPAGYRAKLALKNTVNVPEQTPHFWSPKSAPADANHMGIK